jgi:hypothetical protein
MLRYSIWSTCSPSSSASRAIVVLISVVIALESSILNFRTMYLVYLAWCTNVSSFDCLICSPRKNCNSPTTRNYLICDAFSAMFSENITNVHCSPEHCDDLLNSSRFYDVFLFFVTDVHSSPKHCDDLLNLSRFYDVFLFFVTDVH